MRIRPPARLFLTLALLVVVCAGFAAPTWAEDETAVVNGITKLFVRRGAGMEFPPFASLSEGSVVEIKGVEGEWARIVTANGQVGYVQRRYLETGKGETTANRPTPTNTRRPTKTPTVIRPTNTPTVPRPTFTPSVPKPTATSTVARATHSPTERPWKPTPTRPAPTEMPSVEPRRTSARERATPVVEDPTPTSTPSYEPTEAPAPPAANSDGGAGQPVARAAAEVVVPEELRQLRVAVERLQRRLDEMSGGPTSGLPMVNTPEEPPSTISGGAVLLCLLGVLVGWLLGSAYTRNQERGRRSRIRF